MKITILGAGVIGITTAYFLTKAGHKVVVIDRQPGVAGECSFSNASQLSYCSAQPWANLADLKKGIKWLGKKDAPLRFRFNKDLRMWKWLIQFLINCAPSRERENTKHILDVCLYSREVLRKNLKDFDFDFDLKQTGKTLVFEKASDLRAYQKQEQLQEVMGSKYQVLSFDEMLQYEPNIRHLRKAVVGAIRDPLDDTADAYKFCIGLEKKLKEMGVEFHYDTNITDIRKENKHIDAVVTDKGEFKSDMFVMCLGAYSPVISKKIGIRLPVYPIKGYSITVDIKNENAAPQNTITYYSNRTVFSRIGNRMRVSGTAEFAGYDHSATPERIEMLKKLTRKVFPDCGDIDSAAEWACLRPCTPDGRPIIGHSKYDNMFLNTGQGALGWTMAFASAKLTADMIEGKPTEIDAKPFSLKRK